MNNKTNSIYEDAIDILLKAACSSASDKIFDDIDESMSDDEIIFSPQHINAVNQIFRNERKKKKRLKVKFKWLLIAVVIIITLLLSVMTVCAFKERIVNFFINKTHLGTILHCESSEEDNLIGFELIVKYIPQDFEETQKYSDKSECFVMYENNEKYIAVDKMNAPDRYAFNTENAEEKYIDINGNKAMLSINEDVSIIVWTQNGFVYSVSGNTDSDILTEVAQNIS